MRDSQSKNYPIVRYVGDERLSVDDFLAVEEPLQITVDGCPVAVVMRTPGYDEELVKGFLLTEGVVNDLSFVRRMDADFKPNHVLVFLADGVDLDHTWLKRNLFSASSCGICGKASIDAIRQDHPRVVGDMTLSTEVLLSLPRRLSEAQKIFESTGGLHAAGLFSADGELIVLREDVGRHNAIDKVIGHARAAGINLHETVLQLSGRVSFEVMQKSHAVGIPIISAISAPTSLAVDFAKESGQTLIGFLRPPQFNLYAGAQRIVVCSTELQ